MKMFHCAEPKGETNYKLIAILLDPLISKIVNFENNIQFVQMFSYQCFITKLWVYISLLKIYTT